MAQHSYEHFVHSAEYESQLNATYQAHCQQLEDQMNRMFEQVVQDQGTKDFPELVQAVSQRFDQATQDLVDILLANTMEEMQ